MSSIDLVSSGGGMDLFDRVAVGAAVLEDLRRPAIQPVSQFLDGLHVARFAARAAKMRSEMLKSRPSALRRFYRKARRLYKMVLYGRPSGMISIREFDGNIGSWHRVRIAEGLRNPRPKTLGKAPMDFTSMLDPIPELGVISLRHGNVFGSQGWVFTEDKRFVYDISWYGLHAHVGLLPSEFPKPQRIDGRCLVLASDWGNVNYAHFILDCLPRLYLYQEAGYSIADVDYICIPEPPSRSARRTMIALGIPEDKCVWSNDNALLQFDEIIATSFPGSRRNYAQWVPRYLQTILKPVGVLGAPVARKIYVPRRGERKIINEEQLLNIARNYDIEPHDFSNIDNQPERFNECELVIGPHGAGLTNIAFCKPNTRYWNLSHQIIDFRTTTRSPKRVNWTITA